MNVSVNAVASAAAIFVLATVGGEAETYNKTVAAGGLLKADFFASVYPDCSTKGKTVIRVASAPAHGVIVTRQSTGFVNFPGLPQCNERRLAGVSVTYRPARGFTGSDGFSLDVIFPSGKEVMRSYFITVK